MIDKTGTVKIIDFGSTRVTGVVEASPPASRDDILGTVQYTAPEYFLGENGSPRSDLFSLGVITYQMLTGRLPYGAQMARTRTQVAAAQTEIRLGARRQPRDSGLDRRRAEEGRASGSRTSATRRCPNSSTTCALPTRTFVNAASAPLIERNPLLFWKGLSAVLVLVVVVLLAMLQGGR